jgi:hypothetical protein
MFTRSSLILLAFVIALIGYFAPWIAHPVASLNYNGWELTTWAKPLPEVRSGAVQLRATWLYAPLAAAGLGLALHALRRSPRDGAAWALRLLGAGLCLLALPSYPAVLDAWRPAPGVGLNPEFGGQFYLAVIGAALCLGSAALGARPAGVRPALQLVCALAGAVFAPAAFTELLPAISRVYAEPIGWGWGTFLCVAGFAAAGAVAFYEVLKEVLSAEL